MTNTSQTQDPVFQDILLPECILLQQRLQTQQALFRLIADTMQKTLPTLNTEKVLAGFIEREMLTSTAVGHGVAIPHVRLEALTKTLACLVQLKQGIHFNALDNQPVDLVCALLVPLNATHEHLLLLSTLAERFSNPLFRTRLRKARRSQSLYDDLCHTGGNILV